ncbi:jg17574 [Pararge aegeria aegeria]|uniref:Jg17574 protein n=1 Tax=Pararge aegeria aegeria TaxID=348720 RepID=A0A8S4QJ61_9NEOP|nr:jg17574 [Pararge aegeria aegeria]
MFKRSELTISGTCYIVCDLVGPGIKFGEKMEVGVPRCWNGSPEPKSATLIDPQRGGQTNLSAGSKGHRTVELGTPYKRQVRSLLRNPTLVRVTWHSV